MTLIIIVLYVQTMAESTENANFCEDSCVICRQGSDCDTISKVTQRGLLTLISCEK